MFLYKYEVAIMERMNRHTSKRRETALRFFTYGIMTFAVVTISVICILFVLGYRLNTSGQIEQQALLQFRSTPSSATVEIDGMQQSFRTPNKKTVSAGEHTVAMRLNGYRDWSKTFSVEAGSIAWLNYARFVPTNLTTDNVREFDALTDMTPSPDRRWLGIIGDAASPKLTIADIRNEKQPRFSEVEIPKEVLALEEDQEPGKFAIMEWDFGSRYMLVKHEVGGRSDFIRVDRTDASNSKNISQQLKVNIKKAHFIGTSGNAFFALVDGDVRKIDLNGGTISRPLVRKVDDFVLYKSDTIAFTATRDEQKVAGLYEDGDEELVIRTFADDDPVRATVTTYFSDTYLAISHGKSVEILKNPQDGTESAGRVFADFDTPENIEWLLFASSGRFVIAQHANTFTTYDLEEDKQFTTTLAEGEGAIEQRLRWLDDYYLWTDVGGSFRMVEFDGSNQQVLNAAAPGYGATLSQNGQRLFTINKGDNGKMILQSTHMVIE